MRSLDQSLVLVGFGGLGLQLDPELFLRWPSHHFLMAWSAARSVRHRLHMLQCAPPIAHSLVLSTIVGPLALLSHVFTTMAYDAAFGVEPESESESESELVAST